MVFKSYRLFVSFVCVNFSDITVLKIFTVGQIALDICVYLLFFTCDFVLNTYKKLKLIAADELLTEGICVKNHCCT